MIVRPTAVVLFAALVGGCGMGSASTGPDEAIGAAVAAGLPRLDFEVVGSMRRDRSSGTYGLDSADGMMYEGAREPGASWLHELSEISRRRTHAATLPAAAHAGSITEGGGVAVVGPRVWQFATGAGRAVLWDRAELRVVRTVANPRNRRGLCALADGRLLASDGTDRLQRLASDDLAVAGELRVRVGDRPLTGLGELACGPGGAWVGVTGTGWLARFDPGTGRVDAVLDVGRLGPPGRPGAPNGVAVPPESGALLITGAGWPAVYLLGLTGRR